MRSMTLLRISPATWCGPILVVLAAAYTTVLSGTSDPYPLALTAEGAFTAFLVAPVCAACAAWEGGRLRRAGWASLPHVRSPLRIAMTSLAPVIAVGWLAISTAVLYTLRTARVVAVPDLRVMAATFVVVTAHALLGFAIGVRFSTVVAVPAVLLIDYGWMVLPHALEPVWLRHLNGSDTWLSCCSVATDVAPQALVGTLIVALGLAGTASMLLCARHAVRRLAVVPAVLALSLGAVLVQGLGYDAVVPRDPAALVCSAGQPRVCVWPEHRDRLAEVTAIASTAASRWREADIGVPTEFSERSTLSLGDRSFGFSVQSRPSDILNALAYSLLPPVPQCALAGRTEPYIAADLVHAWLVEVAGMPDDEITKRFGPDVSRAVAAVRSLPLRQQRVWLKHNHTALQTCDVAPQLEPGA